MRIYTKTGDDGSTALFRGGRVPKDDPRVEAYGTADEAVAALGVARASTSDPGLGDLILRLQRELFVVGAQLATDEAKWDRLEDGKTRVTPAMTTDLERLIDEHALKTEMPKEFVIPGETAASAAIDLARATVRRCERRCVALQREGMLPDAEVVRYLNRLADLLFVLARYEEGGFTPLRRG